MPRAGPHHISSEEEGSELDVDNDYHSVEQEAMEQDPHKGKKRKKKKPAKKLPTTDEDTTQEEPGETRGNATRTEKRTKGMPNAKPREAQPSTSGSGLSNEPVEFRTRLGQAQLCCVNAIAPLGGILTREQLEGITASVQMITNICTDLIARNAYLEGRLEPQSNIATQHIQRRTYAEAVGGQSRAGQSQPSDTQGEALLTPRDRDEGKAALLLYPTKPNEQNGFAQVSSILKSSIDPEDLGLREPVLKPIRGGAVITSSCKEGIEKLEQIVTTNSTLKQHLRAKRPYSRNPQLKIRGVVTADPAIIRRKLITHNKLQGTEDDIQIIHLFSGNNGLSTVIVEVTPGIFSQLQEKERVFLDWTSCPIEENLHVPFCKRCSSYGHTAARCQSEVRCCNCGQKHPLSECQAGVYKCPCCTEVSQRDKSKKVDTRHSALSEKCPTYQLQVERLKRKIRYQ